ncbi:hypothetical protein BM477_03265 [Boudabousia marimammalium]|uniref:Polyprenyl synthetase n=1 Tax=Boudabousia marimammalium TaxID=156892 RepID=A0A1Q5PQU7_9ACTO|nr:hypothetical protein BM477_03265 [Boudabousia marimammalium]
MASVQGGKRLRALCVHAGYLLSVEDDSQISADSAEQLALLGSATEFYQASALVHDDLVDHSDLRRGKPTTHVRASQSHLATDSAKLSDFGTASAVLVGDITYALALECATEAVREHPAGMQILRDFAQMTKRVAIGQYLDVVLDMKTVNQSLDTDRPIEVINYKTAGYSVIDPVCLGAQFANISGSRLSALWKAISSWGVAFQLRDDQLGVFSPASDSGKPAQHDLVEGKRTYLLALTLQLCSSSERKLLERLYSQPIRSTEDCLTISQLMETSGAREAVDNKIDELYQQGVERLAKLDFPNSAPLLDLSESLVYRTR